MSGERQRPPRGFFITFEGPEGSGKTAQAKALANFLRDQGYKVYSTAEPGGTAFGNVIRDLLLNPRGPSFLLWPEIFLFSAARAQLVQEILIPRLQEGEIVISDRFADSTIAYQGYGYGADRATLEQISTINRIATVGLRPDLTFYLDLPVEMGLARRKSLQEKNRTNEFWQPPLLYKWDRLDQKSLDFHHRVVAGYQELMEAAPGRWVRIDATGEVMEVAERIRKKVTPYIEDRLKKGQIATVSQRGERNGKSNPSR